MGRLAKHRLRPPLPAISSPQATIQKLQLHPHHGTRNRLRGVENEVYFYFIVLGVSALYL
jgi:hypothetical protein